MADDEKQQPGNGGTSQDVPWQVILSTVASVLAVLAFFGITDFWQLRQKLAADPDTSSPAAVPSAFTPRPFTFRPGPDFGDDTGSPTPESTEFDPASLDDSSTDETPFTQSALLAGTFTNSLGVRYKRVAGGVHGCTEAYAMTGDVRDVLSSHGCTEVMTGDYLVDSATVTDRNDILVSVQVFPFDSSSTAEQVYDSFAKGGSWDFGVWCPLSGRGQNACTSGYESARRRNYIRRHHRYLIEATALYTSLGDDISLRRWIDAAADEAVDVCGPENYTGNR